MKSENEAARDEGFTTVEQCDSRLKVLNEKKKKIEGRIANVEKIKARLKK